MTETSNSDVGAEIMKKIIENIKICTSEDTTFQDVASTLLRKQGSTTDILPQLLELPEGAASKLNWKRYDPRLYQRIFVSHPSTRSLSDIFKDVKSGHISFVGPAGSGKTTLLKTIARNVMDKKYEGLQKVEIVLFLKCGDFNHKKKISPCELFLSNVHPQLTIDQQKAFAEYIKQHPNKVLFILDALDTFGGDVRKAKKVSKPMNVAYPADSLHSLFHGELFPNCLIITSSRDMTITPVRSIAGEQNEHCKKKVFFLLGLTMNDMYGIVHRHFEETESREIMKYLRMNPSLMKLCQTPVFLSFTLLGKREDPKFAPTTMSEILIFLLLSLVHSEHTREKEIMEVLSKLKPLCFKMTNEGKVNFSTVELKEFGITVDEIKDLAIVVQGGRNHSIFFSHQSIQELFASFHIAGMNPERFKKFMERYLLNPSFTIIIRILCGILFNQRICNASKQFFNDEKLDEKQELLKNALERLIKEMTPDANVGVGVLQVMLCLHEAGDGVDHIIKTLLKQVVLENVVLSLSDVHAIGSVVGRCRNLQDLTILASNLQHDELKVLLDCLETKGSKISKMNFSFNHLTEKAMMYIGQLVRFCRVIDLDVSSPSLTREHLEFFKNALHDYQLQSLNISYYTEMDSEEKMKQFPGCTSYDVKYNVDQDEKIKKENIALNFPQQMTMQVQTWGFWDNASYEFIHMVGSLLPNVTDKLTLYGWKISSECKELLQTKLDALKSTGLEVHLTKFVLSSKHSKMKTSSQMEREECEEDEVAECDPGPNEYVGCGPSAKMECALGPTKYIKLVKKLEKNIRTAATSEEEFWMELKKITDIPNFVDYLKKISPSMLIDRLRVSQKFDTEDIPDLASILQIISNVRQLELRGYEITVSSLSKLLDIMCKHGQEIPKIFRLSITTAGIDELMPTICAMIDKCKTEDLKIEETGVDSNSNFLKILYDNVRELEVNTLRLLDVSYNSGLTDFTSLGKVIDSCELKELKMMNCALETEKLEELCNAITKSQVDSLDISCNQELVADDIKLLPKILKKGGTVEQLSMSGCDLTEEEMEGFESSAFFDMKIRKLDMSYNDKLEYDGVYMLGRSASNLNVEDLSLAGCELDEDCIDSLETSLQGNKLRNLNISDNRKIGLCMPKVAGMVNKSGINRLNMSDCKLTASQIRNFTNTLRSNKLTHLNLSDSESYPTVDHITAICELIPRIENELVVCFPSMETQFVEKLQMKLNETSNNKLRIVYNLCRRTNNIGYLTISGNLSEKYLSHSSGSELDTELSKMSLHTDRFSTASTLLSCV